MIRRVMSGTTLNISVSKGLDRLNLCMNKNESANPFMHTVTHAAGWSCAVSQIFYLHCHSGNCELTWFITRVVCVWGH